MSTQLIMENYGKCARPKKPSDFGKYFVQNALFPCVFTTEKWKEECYPKVMGSTPAWVKNCIWSKVPVCDSKKILGLNALFFIVDIF